VILAPDRRADDSGEGERAPLPCLAASRSGGSRVSARARRATIGQPGHAGHRPRGGGTGRRGGLKHRRGQPRASSNLALGTSAVRTALPVVGFSPSGATVRWPHESHRQARHSCAAGPRNARIDRPAARLWPGPHGSVSRRETGPTTTTTLPSVARLTTRPRARPYRRPKRLRFSLPSTGAVAPLPAGPKTRSARARNRSAGSDFAEPRITGTPSLAARR
jgi:hypothetical protein